jgi:hypothetical protein
MFYGSQAGQNFIQLLVRQQKRISTGKYDILYFRSPLDVFQALAQQIIIHRGRSCPAAAHTAFASTETAVNGTLFGYQPKHPVRIAMNHIGQRAVFLFLKGVLFSGIVIKFGLIGHRLLPYRITNLGNQVQIIRSYSHWITLNDRFYRFKSLPEPYCQSTRIRQAIF